MAFSFFSTGATSEVNFIPEVFSKLLQAKFYSTSVMPSISTTEYEGEIRGQGDKVIIRTVPAVTINDYAGTVSNQELQTGTVELAIDKAKYYSFRIDDVLAAQADINMLEAASADAAEGMRIAIETDVLAGVIGDATTTTAQTTITSSNILSKILEISEELDGLNIPEEGRYIVLPPSMVNMLKQSELRQAYLTGDATSPLRNGQVAWWIVSLFTSQTSSTRQLLALTLLTPTFLRVIQRRSRSRVSSLTLKLSASRALLVMR